MGNSSGDDSPFFRGLFSEERESLNSSGEDSYSENEREWRDAVKAAVEAEIHYQVQLRLALDYPTRKERKRQEKANDIEEDGYCRSRQVKPKADTTEHADPHHTASNGDDACENYMPPPPSKHTEEAGDEKHKKIKQEQELLQQQQQVATESARHERKEPRNVYDYLHQKYGVPREQLQGLSSTGRFQCKKEHQIRGMDERVRWPLECSITQPTPQLSTDHKQQGIPFFPDGPVLGQARPSFLRTAEECKMVFDRKADAEQLNEPTVHGDEDLKFESRFECGNLQQALKVLATENISE